jgi:hypothetical protein
LQLHALGDFGLTGAPGIIGIGDRLGESLDQLLCGVVVAEVG